MAGRLFEATISQTYFGQECVNRFNYVSDVVTPDASGAAKLAQSMGVIAPSEDPDPGSLIALMQALSNTNVQWNAISVRDVYSDFDFVEIPLGFSGLHATDGLSPAVAYGFKTNRTRLDIRRGFKRLVGVSEGAVATGGVLTGTGISGSVSVAAAMSEQLVGLIGSTTVTYTPVIVKKESYDVPDSGTPPRKAFRYYEDETEQLTLLMRDLIWSHYTQVRTQNSRQYGKGR